MKSILLSKSYTIIILVCILIVSAGYTCSDPPFDRVQQKHIHNSYARNESLYIQARDFMVRSFELDLHNGYWDPIFPIGTWNWVNGDWCVAHEEPNAPCLFFSNDLLEIKSIEGENPNHEVITIWIELKDSLEGSYNHTPSALDTLLKNVIGEDKIYKPIDILNRCAWNQGYNSYRCINDSSKLCSFNGSLQTTVQQCGWPAVSELRGKFMFVVLGQADSYRTEVDMFKLLGLYPHVAFLQNGSDDLFLNSDNINDYSNNGLVFRVTEVDTNDGFVAAINKGIQYIGTNKVSYENDNWSTTNNTHGWPFRCMDGIYDCSSNNENPHYTIYPLGLFPDGFPYQLYWGSRTTGVGYSGASEWFVDLNGDGKADHINNKDGSSEYMVMVGLGDKFATDTSWGSRAYGVGYSGRSEWFVDLNGDGKADHVYNHDGTKELRVRLSNGNGFDTETLWGSRTTGVGYSGLSEWFVDLNGDGKADHINNKDGSKEYMVMLSLGNGFGTDTSWGSRICGVGYSGRSEWFVDLNGDGKADHVYNCDGKRELKVRLSNGNGFGTETLWGNRAYGVGYSGLSEWLIDLNHDGKADHIYNRDGTRDYWVMLARPDGTGFYADTYWGTRTYGVGYSGRSEWFVDINGDGKPDHVYNRDGTNEYWVQYNTGNGFGPDQLLSKRVGNAGYSGRSEWFIDVNGDGKADHISNRDPSKELWVRLSNF